ncbi:MAG: phosphodiester glycosidase family protein [Vulcanimicrobiaceae bacterium]
MLIILAVLVVGFFAARDPIERSYLQWQLGQTVGGDAAIDGLHHGDGATILEGVHLQSKGGAFTLDADQLDLQVVDGVLHLRAHAPRVSAALDSVQGDEAQRLRDFGGWLGAHALALEVQGGTLSLARGAGATQTLAFENATGTARLDADGTFSADLQLALRDGGATYPIVLRSQPADAGAAGVQLTANELPLTPFSALFVSDRLALTAGVARAVDLRLDAGGPHGTLALADVGANLGGVALHSLSGQVTVAPDGVGATLLTGAVGAIPVNFSGEVHDVHSWPALLDDGTPDLRAVVRLFGDVATQPAVSWMTFETTAPGIAYGQYGMTLADIPRAVSVLLIDPAEPTLRFDTAIADDHIISRGARTSQLADRTGAVAGVNGDYFDIGRTYEPQGLLMRGGVLLRGPADREALVIDKHNHVTFAVFRMRGAVVDGTRRYGITQLNSWPLEDTTVITPDYGADLRPADGVTFEPLVALGGDRYRVVSALPATAPIPAQLGVAFGPKANRPLPRPGDVVTMNYGLDPAVPDAVAGVGGGPLLLQNGAWYEDPKAPAPAERDVRWAVVALGTLSDQSLLLMTVDARHPERSMGMTRPEFGDLLRSFGVTDAMALDSGGSVTMVSRAPGDAAASLRNAPSDENWERVISDALLLYSTAPPGTLVTTRATPLPQARIVPPGSK